MARQIRNSRRGRRAGLRKGTRKGTRKGMRAGSRKGTRKGKKTYKKRRNSRRQIRGGGLTPGERTEAEEKAQDELNNDASTGTDCSPEEAKVKAKYIKDKLQQQSKDYKTFPLYKWYYDINKTQKQQQAQASAPAPSNNSEQEEIVKSLLREKVISICTGDQNPRNRRLKNLLCETLQRKNKCSISETDINILVDKFYDNIVQKGGIKTDNDGNVVKFLIGVRLDDGFDNTLESIFNNMTFDISQLKMLPQLTMINLNGRKVTGSIEHLKSLQNLTYINLSNARDVTVSSEDLNTILHRPNLNKFVVDSTQVDISNISEEVKHKLSPMP